MQAFKASDYTLKELLDCDTTILEILFTSHTTIDNQRFDQLTRYFERMNKAKNHPGFTFLFHYQEYVQQVKNPYSYTQFMEHYHRKYVKLRGSMKLNHDPGKELYIDFAGKKLQIVDRLVTCLCIFIGTMIHNLIKKGNKKHYQKLTANGPIYDGMNS